MKIAIVYWSGTGNTKLMAQAALLGAQEKGYEVDLYEAREFTRDQVKDYDGFLFGCPSMGIEILEENEFLPMFEDVLPLLGDKPVLLFGSYGWGQGEWMEDWELICDSAGVNLLDDGFICRKTPGPMELEGCRTLVDLFEAEVG